MCIYVYRDYCWRSFKKYNVRRVERFFIASLSEQSCGSLKSFVHFFVHLYSVTKTHWYIVNMSITYMLSIDHYMLIVVLIVKQKY